jgi:hypothetical protein
MARKLSFGVVASCLLSLGCGCASPDKQPEVTTADGPKPTVAVTTPPPASAAPTTTEAPANSGPASNPAMSDVITIEKATQYTGGDLKIGASNFWEEEYTPEGGSPKKGMTCQLWIYVKDQKDMPVRVHPGKIVNAPNGWRIEVLSIDERAVRLGLKKTPPP